MTRSPTRKMFLPLTVACLAATTVDLAHGNDADPARIRAIISSRGTDAAAPAQLVQLTRELEPAAAAMVFDQVAGDLVEQGHYGAAAHYRELLVEKYPQQPAARHAILWLLRLMCSGEMAHARNAGSASDSTEQPASPFDPELLMAAVHLATDAAQADPTLTDDPALIFQQGVAERLRGSEQGALRFLTRLKHGTNSDLWRQRALAESWLAERVDAQRTTTAAPANLISAAAARTRPRLDGRFSELVWQASQAIKVADAPAATSVRLAYDAEYLYVALRAEKLPEFSYAADDRRRPQDGADRMLDHVRLLLDLDRDYATSFEIVVDCRGWTADAVWGNSRWNPQWFVAWAEAPQAWQVECAIPLAELTPSPPGAADAWVCAISRQTAPNDRATGEFQLLLFE